MKRTYEELTHDVVMRDHWLEELRADLKDAERYRYMRSNGQFQDRNGPGVYWYLPRWGRELPLGERLDAAIDAAMAAEEGQ